MSDPRNDHQNEVPIHDPNLDADPDLVGGRYAGERPMTGADGELLDDGLLDEDPDLVADDDLEFDDDDLADEVGAATPGTHRVVNDPEEGSYTDVDLDPDEDDTL